MDPCRVYRDRLFAYQRSPIFTLFLNPYFLPKSLILTHYEDLVKMPEI